LCLYKITGGAVIDKSHAFGLFKNVQMQGAQALEGSEPPLASIAGFWQKRKALTNLAKVSNPRKHSSDFIFSNSSFVQEMSHACFSMKSIPND
jgi:hypothetical protein